MGWIIMLGTMLLALVSFVNSLLWGFIKIIVLFVLLMMLWDLVGPILDFDLNNLNELLKSLGVK